MLADEQKDLIVISCVEPSRFVAVKKLFFANLQFEFEFDRLGDLTHIRTKRFITGPFAFLWKHRMSNMGSEQTTQLLQIANRQNEEAESHQLIESQVD